MSAPASRRAGSRRPLVVVGDTLLDRDLEGQVDRLCPDAPVPVIDELEQTSRPGGAGLAAALAASEGRPVTLVTALAGDEAGRELANLLGRCGVEVVDLGLHGQTPQKVRVRSGGQSLLRLDHGSRHREPVGPCPATAADAMERAGAVLLADYGRGVAAEPGLRHLLAHLPVRTPLVWDPHPRGPEPVAGVRLATPNRSEAAAAVPGPEG
ncbi:MAG: PfkB family carbohydrate kinase, partial [Actinomycetota bacterium]|nr:PfkB family carbohydrate kinase [Actinomycetota bacterium]